MFHIKQTMRCVFKRPFYAKIMVTVFEPVEAATGGTLKKRCS